MILRSFRRIPRSGPCLKAALLVLGAAGVMGGVQAQAIRSKTFESLSPNEKVSIVSRCDGERRNCNVTARAGSEVVEIGPRDYPSGPSIHWVNLDTAAVMFKCGEGCEDTWFYNTRMGSSAAYRGVLTIDGIRLRAAVLDVARQEIAIQPIQAREGVSPSCRVKWAYLFPDRASVVPGKEDVVFGSDGNLKRRQGGGSQVVTGHEKVVLDSAGRCAGAE